MTDRFGCAAEIVVVAMLAGVLAFAVFVAGSPEMTSRWNTREEERTARIVAQEQGRTAREVAWQQTLQTNGPWAAGAIVLVVIAVQAGRTWRHREDRQAETRRLLVAYVTANYLPSERVCIEDRRGQLAIVDYERRQVIPAGLIEAEYKLISGPTSKETR